MPKYALHMLAYLLNNDLYVAAVAAAAAHCCRFDYFFAAIERVSCGAACQSRKRTETSNCASVTKLFFSFFFFVMSRLLEWLTVHVAQHLWAVAGLMLAAHRRDAFAKLAQHKWSNLLVSGHRSEPHVGVVA